MRARTCVCVCVCVCSRYDADRDVLGLIDAPTYLGLPHEHSCIYLTSEPLKYHLRASSHDTYVYHATKEIGSSLHSIVKILVFSFRLSCSPDFELMRTYVSTCVPYMRTTSHLCVFVYAFPGSLIRLLCIWQTKLAYLLTYTRGRRWCLSWKTTKM